MTETTTITQSPAACDGDIRPGDHVTILLYSDNWTRTSTVDNDGFYVGCGAVDTGRAHIVAIRRGRRHSWALSSTTPSSG